MGPIRGLRFVHNAIKAELVTLDEQAAGMTDATEAADIAAPVKALTELLRGHAQGEDEGYFSRLGERAPHSVASFVADHAHEAPKLDQLDALVDACAAGDGDLTALQRSLHALREECTHHMVKEETLLWPLTEELFSPPEQGEIMGAIVAVIPKESMPKLVPWLVNRQTPDDAEAYVRMLSVAMPAPVYEAARGWIAGAVRPDLLNELRQRIPEL